MTSLIDQAADYAELKLPEHRLMVQRAFMAGALAVLTSKTPRDELIAECVQFGRAIGTQAERATA